MISGRNKSRASNSNINQLLASARKAVAESRAREDELKSQLEKALADKAAIEKTSEETLVKEKAQLECCLKEEKAALERSFEEEKAALKLSLKAEKDPLESSLKKALDECNTLKKKVDSLERKYATECRSRIYIEKELNKLKKKEEEAERQRQQEEEEEEKGTVIFGMQKATNRTVDTTAITKNQKVVEKDESKKPKIRFGF